MVDELEEKYYTIRERDKNRGSKSITVHFVPVITLCDAQKSKISRCKTRDFQPLG